MQTSFGTIAACAAVTFAVMIFTPSNKEGQPSQAGAIAQNDAINAEGEKDTDVKVYDISAIVEESFTTRYNFEKIMRLAIELEAARLELQSAGVDFSNSMRLVESGSATRADLTRNEARLESAQNKIQLLRELLSYGKEKVPSHNFADVVETIEVVALSDFDPRRFGMHPLNDQLVVRGDAEVQQAVTEFIQAIHKHRQADDPSSE